MIFEDIISLAVSNGIFAVLFVFLLFYQLKDSGKREKKYQATIEKLSSHLDIVEDVKESLLEIKNVIIFERKEKKSVNENKN